MESGSSSVGISPERKWFVMTPNQKAFVAFLSGASIEGLGFSRDGKWVTYVSYPEGTLWQSTIDSEQKLQLTNSPMIAALPRWSPNGKQIAFMGQYPDQPWRVSYCQRMAVH
jgi:WD40-like Beta Propeller Repeat